MRSAAVSGLKPDEKTILTSPVTGLYWFGNARASPGIKAFSVVAVTVGVRVLASVTAPVADGVRVFVAVDVRVGVIVDVHVYVGVSVYVIEYVAVSVMVPVSVTV